MKLKRRKKCHFGGHHDTIQKRYTLQGCLQITQCLSLPVCNWSCLDDNQMTHSSTPTSSVSCSPRWIVYPKTYSFSARMVSPAATQKQCLDACIDDPSCIAVEWRVGGTRPNSRCYMHDRRLPRQQNDAVTLFEIVRRCYAESSMSRNRCGKR